MAIVVTKRGTPKSETKWVGSCSKCGSEAEALESDMRHITNDQREGTYAWETCPVCNAGDETYGYGGMFFYPKKTS